MFQPDCRDVRNNLIIDLLGLTGHNHRPGLGFDDLSRVKTHPAQAN